MAGETSGCHRGQAREEAPGSSTGFHTLSCRDRNLGGIRGLRLGGQDGAPKTAPGLGSWASGVPELVTSTTRSRVHGLLCPSSQSRSRARAQGEGASVSTFERTGSTCPGACFKPPCPSKLDEAGHSFTQKVHEAHIAVGEGAVSGHAPRGVCSAQSHLKGPRRPGGHLAGASPEARLRALTRARQGCGGRRHRPHQLPHRSSPPCGRHCVRSHTVTLHPTQLCIPRATEQSNVHFDLILTHFE